MSDYFVQPGKSPLHLRPLKLKEITNFVFLTNSLGAEVPLNL